MFDVFISHSVKDARVALAARHFLERLSIRCWKAPEDIAPGEIWEEAITRAIRTTKGMLLIWSANSQESKQVARELALASSFHKMIIPFRIEDVRPEGTFAYYLTNTHWLDALSPDREEDLKRLGDLIVSLLPEIKPAEDVNEGINLNPTISETSSQVSRAQVQADSLCERQQQPLALSTPTRLTGDDLLAMTASLEEESVARKAEASGYVTYNSDGTRRIDYSSYMHEAKKAERRRDRRLLVQSSDAETLLKIENEISILAEALIELCRDSKKSLLLSDSIALNSSTPKDIREKMKELNPESSLIQGNAFACHEVRTVNDGNGMIVFFDKMFAWIDAKHYQAYGVGSYTTTVKFLQDQAIITISDEGKRSCRGQVKKDIYRVTIDDSQTREKLQSLIDTIGEIEALESLHWIKSLRWLMKVTEDIRVPWEEFTDEYWDGCGRIGNTTKMAERHLDLFSLLSSLDHVLCYGNNENYLDLGELLGACLASVVPFREYFYRIAPVADPRKVSCQGLLDYSVVLEAIENIRRSSNGLYECTQIGQAFERFEEFVGA